MDLDVKFGVNSGPANLFLNLVTFSVDRDHYLYLNKIDLTIHVLSQRATRESSQDFRREHRVSHKQHLGQTTYSFQRRPYVDMVRSLRSAD